MIQIKEQLGIIIDTNRMIVKMTSQKITALKTELAHWHSQQFHIKNKLLHYWAL